MSLSSGNVVVSRRTFIRKTAQSSAGLYLAVMFPACADVDTVTSDKTTISSALSSSFEANAFVRVGTDSIVTVMVPKLEMGQGTYTGLATLVAEELGADWRQVVVSSAPVDPRRYGPQATGGSNSISSTYTPLREAGASARQMLIAAAAQLWQVNVDTLTVKQGVILHKSSRRQATFGQLAPLAAQQPLPASVALKDPEKFTLIGKILPRKDSGKTDGSAIFTQDMQLPGMLTAVVAHPPLFGATLVKVDIDAVKVVPGVVEVVMIDNAVAVLAQTFWQARKGRDQLKIQWDETGAFKQSSEALLDQYHKLAETPGAIAQQQGDVESAFMAAHTIVEASYEFPFLAHAAMEPLNCVVQIRGHLVDIWNGCQLQSTDQKAVAALLGIPPEQVNIHTLFAGGSFGRRANPHSDYVLEAARIAKAYGKPVPIKLVWTREDDTRAGYYRPMMVHRLKAGLDQQGNLLAWQHRIVGQSISQDAEYDFLIKNGVDVLSVEGAVNMPYQIPSVSVELHTVELPVPVLWWRSVASTHTAFATEVFLDECAAKSQQDPLAFRFKHLKEHPKHQQTLQLASKKASWDAPLPSDRARGVALHKSFNTTVAQVAEVSILDSGQYRVEKVTCAVDCGLAINPDVISAQMEGGIGFGLSPTLMSEITFRDGKVEQSSFHDYQVIRMAQMPEVTVYIVPSTESPTGVGEPGTPVIAPAVANALYAITSLPQRRLPLRLPESG